MTLKREVIEKIEDQAWIDRAAEPVQAVVKGALENAPALADALHGRFLGHPLHPALIPIPIGAWTIGFALDVSGARRYRRSADLLTAVGLGGALVAATAGIADWSRTTGPARRVGFVHGALNVLIAGVYGLSLYARGRGARRAGVALSTVGFAALGFSAWLGGELAYRFGVGVRLLPEAAPAPRAKEEERIGVARL